MDQLSEAAGGPLESRDSSPLAPAADRNRITALGTAYLTDLTAKFTVTSIYSEP
jgi:hypothetical protein